jgi:glucan phosphoethanolaminetransferase (alkaline phosphatase superfamily)
VAMPDYMSEAGRTAEAAVRKGWPQVGAMIGWRLVLFVLGAAFIALMPKGVAALQTIAEKRPFRNLGVGLLAFAAVIGLVPLVALTVIGIVLLPFVAIFIAIACSLAYLAGVYFTGTQIGRAFFRIETNAHRLAILVASIVIAALIGLIPFAGWLVSLGLTTFGFGAVAVVLMVRWSRDAAARLAPAGGAAAPAV